MASVIIPKAPSKIPRPHSQVAPKTELETQPHSTQSSDLDELYASFDRSMLRFNNLDWPVVIWMSIIHVGAIATLAFFPTFFTWPAFACFFVMHWMTASLGICLGYHRFLSHRSMKLAKPVEFFMTLCGVLSGEGSPLTWAATHRLHHQKSDQRGDPHSPVKEDGVWAHFWWIFVRRDKKLHDQLLNRYVPDLMRQPTLRFFEKTYGLFLVASGVALYLVGGWPFLFWGLFLRMAVAYHSTWFVNSATHLWGYRTYQTKDQSRNLWWVALVSYGEGWHNNHHAHPANARAGHRWWEIDMTYWTIKTLKVLGLAKNVHDEIPTEHTLVEG
ncbi:MAG: fatty acid desaturase [Planctomycetaceae bacterium]